MAILKILKDGEPLLRKKSRHVDNITPRLRRLLDDMIDTLRDASGVGLAAPQVGVLRRIVVLETEDGTIIELINPEIADYSKERQHQLEGCLSLPNVWGITDRPQTVTVTAVNREGNPISITGTALMARALCHELDHLDGKLFSDEALRILTEEEVEKLREREQTSDDGAGGNTAVKNSNKKQRGGD